MQKLILSTFLILLLVPFSQAFSQVTDNPFTLSVSLRNEIPFLYQDSEGYTVVVGIVENNNSQTPVDNVRIQVNFFDDFDPNPLQVVNGHTTLQVIPPNGQSPFSIRSETANPYITEASVSLLPFDISDPKDKKLSIFYREIFLDSSLHFSGVLQNEIAPISNTNVYLAFYDIFERILRVSTIEIGDVESNDVAFEFDESINSKSVGFLLFSESDKFYSDLFEESHTEVNAKDVANIITTDLMGLVDTREKREESKITPTHLKDLVDSIQSGKISRNSAKNALYEIVKTGKDLSQVMSELDLGNVSDESELLGIIKAVISEEPKAVEEAKSNPQTINYLVGKVMQKTKGKADPKLTLDLFKKEIE